ncbi:tol-pal system protein YbgF [Marinobacter bryozoorum]|jgi:tol-pal system protein YbgF|uniref:tol-pal system protein YbgF n=1 Tax=Marinobacter bryozoorum TaxID=256324 RepID=UPI002005E879|nr:tol-pal system protein YbgF [Marinobacter bryozoorum]MCK7544167.1 tol-pal system protein YbgF [Marinobacter bryozoorum]
MRKLLVAAVALAASAGALAQSSTPAYQNNQSEARRQAAGNQGNAELFYMIERLQREVRDLRGEVEQQQHQLDQLTRQSRERYIDLDQRLLELSEQRQQTRASSGNRSGDTAAPGSQERQTPQTVSKEYREPSEEERQAYDRIQKLIQEQKAYDQAIGELYDFVSEYPEGDLTVNAYYWLGEVYLVKPQLEQAKQAFTIVATRYQDHRKAPDALYKLGVVHDRMGEKEQAERYMKRVVDQYGASQAASLAKKYLGAS